MKRRSFLQSITAVVLAPSLPLKALASKVSTPLNASYTPYMQGHALALLRTKEALSIQEFRALTGLNSAQTKVMLTKFKSLGLIRVDPLSSTMIEAVRPDWMRSFADRTSLAQANINKEASNSSLDAERALKREGTKISENDLEAGIEREERNDLEKSIDRDESGDDLAKRSDPDESNEMEVAASEISPDKDKSNENG